MKPKLIWYILAVVIALGLVALSYGLGRNYETWTSTVSHIHQWGSWERPSAGPDTTTAWIQFRYCTNCGFAEFRAVEQAK